MPLPGPLVTVRFTAMPGPPAGPKSLPSPTSAESNSGPFSALAFREGVVGSGPLRVSGTCRTVCDCAETATGNNAITNAIHSTSTNREHIVSLLSVISGCAGGQPRQILFL